MAKLKFVHGVMKSGKSMDLIKVYTNYQKTGRNVLVLSPSTDTRDNVGHEAHITSRLGEDIPAKRIKVAGNRSDKLDMVVAFERGVMLDISHHPENDISCVLVDEAQFLAEEQVKQLANVVDKENIPVICYGLKNTFKNTLFEGSRALLEYADEIVEVKTVCQFCNKKATMNLLERDGKPVFDGDDVFIGDLEFYPVCRKHYNAVKNGSYKVTKENN